MQYIVWLDLQQKQIIFLRVSLALLIENPHKQELIFGESIHLHKHETCIRHVSLSHITNSSFLILFAHIMQDGGIPFISSTISFPTIFCRSVIVLW